MPRPKIPVEDRLEIQELFAYYAWGLNTGDAEEVLACFTEDCSFEHLPQGIFRGHDQLRVLLNHLWYDKPGWFIGRQHLASHFIMTPRGEKEMHV
jgi:ketosteroid isomerase-like protein